MRTATEWGTQESGSGEQLGFMTTGGSKTGKATSKFAGKPGAGGRHRASYGVRERAAGRRENLCGESSGVGGVEGGRKAYGVAVKSSGVEVNEGGREAYGVAETLGGGGGLGSVRGGRVTAGHLHPQSGQVAPGGPKIRSGH